MTTREQKSFSVRIYLQDGHADGVKIVSKSKWTGRGLVIPRAAFAREQGREELNAAGIYVLVGLPVATEPQRICIGAANPVGTQLQHHDIHDGFWSSAIVFTCKENSLNDAQCQYIAGRLLQSARDTHTTHGNSMQSHQPELNKAELSEARDFLNHMLSLYPLFGVTSFKS